MVNRSPSSIVASPPLSFHARVVPIAAALLIAVCVTDLFYWRTLLVQWETFSIWLLTGGLILAGVAGLALLVDLVVRRTPRVSGARLLAFAAAALLSLVNAFVHSRDGYTAVVPSGIALSAIVAAILLVAGFGGWDLDARPHATAVRA